MERERERERERPFLNHWIQVDPMVKKNAFINADILIRISFIILIYNISYLSLIPKICIFFSLLSLSHPLHVPLSSVALPPPFS